MELSYLLSPSFQASDINGKPLTGGYIEVYVHGTSHTKYITFSDFVGNRNPFRIPLNDKGMASIICDASGEYDVYCYNTNGVQQWSRERVRCVSVQSIIYEGDKVTVSGVQGHTKVTASAVGDQTNYEVDLDDEFVKQVNDNTNDISDVVSALENKKNKQQPYSVSGNATKTVKSVSQNANGNVSVEFENIEFPQQVPNVEITSPNDTIDVQSSVDPQTNTKTFEIDVKGEDVDNIWAHFTNDANWVRVNRPNIPFRVSAYLSVVEGSLSDSSRKLPAGLYHFDLELAYYPYLNGLDSYDKINLTVKYGNLTLRAESFLFDGSIIDNTDAPYQTEWSSGIFEMPEEGVIDIYIQRMTSNTQVAQLKVSHLFIHKIGATSSGGGSGGTTYTAGEAIDITNDKISVNYGSGLEVDPQTNKLKVKIGKGLKFDEESLEVEIDNDVSDVVETVEKLEQDLDTQLTVNFDMANITHTYDFADSSVTTLSNGATMLCQAFTVPINHEIRVASATEDPTLLGIYAKQPYATKIMLALYVYDFETGYTDYVADTGPVMVKAGRNEFPLVHINPNIGELKSSCVYYAALYLPSSHNNGLYLASCANYATASYINATPRFSVGVQNITYNGSEIDMTDATTGRLDYNDGNGNYYIGPWSDGYNERPDAPRFFMQLRNGAVEIPVSTDPFTDIGAYTLKATSTVQDIFGNTLTPLNSGVIFQAVEPAQNVTITEWTVYDTNATDSLQFGGNVFPSDFDNQNMVSQTSSCTVTELGEIGTGTGIYGHKYTPNTPIQLSANTTYRFPACVATPGGLSNAVAQYDTPTVQKELHLFESGYNVSQWATYSRANNVQGTFLKLKDSDNNEYVI